MSPLLKESEAAREPIRNMRITFWGTQGSCQYFPKPNEIHDYNRLVALEIVQRIFQNLGQTFGDAGTESLSLSTDPAFRELLSGTADESTLRAYLEQRIGLPDPPVYGGETTCVEVETAEGTVIVLDGGSGIRHFARNRIAQWADRTERVLYVFGSHDHLDHRIGLPFCDICFANPHPFELRVFGHHEFLETLDERFGMFSQRVSEITYQDDPLDFRVMSAKFLGTELRNGDGSAGPADDPSFWTVHDISEPVRIGNTTVTAFEVYHGPKPCYAYKIEHGGASFVFCTDHEYRHGSDPDDPRQKASEIAEQRLIEQCQGVDAAYFDGQYFLDEYHGRAMPRGASFAVPRVDWGHSCIEDVVARARACGIKQTFIGHHDPDRQWLDRVQIDRRLREQSAGTGCHIELAKDRSVLDL